MTYDQLEDLKAILDECQLLSSFAAMLAEADDSTGMDYAITKLTQISEQCSRIGLKIETFGKK